MVTGALIGSTLGTIVSSNILNCITDPTVKAAALLSKFIVSWILAFLAVVIFKRRKDVQSFVTIEDLWGGRW
jgi:uncharacterized membrane protein YdjX (TVP38/TMEM64 family)